MNFRGGAGFRPKRVETTVDITALIDVVFQLIIFFLLTSSYVTQSADAPSPQIEVDLPQSSLEAQANPIEELTVAITAEGEIFMGQDERVSVEELRVRLIKAANKNPETVVLIRGDQKVPYGRVAEVMESVRLSRLRINAQLQGQ